MKSFILYLIIIILLVSVIVLAIVTINEKNNLVLCSNTESTFCPYFTCRSHSPDADPYTDPNANMGPGYQSVLVDNMTDGKVLYASGKPIVSNPFNTTIN